MTQRKRNARPIFLIGYMGSGKTTLGRALAARTGCRFIDLDDFIEADERMSIKEIFAAKGEAGFREIERQALRKASADTAKLQEKGETPELPTIISCGGGTPCFFDNMEYMNSSGVTVFLDASLEALNRRLGIMRSNRPLIAYLSDDELNDFIVAALEKRRPSYQKAAYSFNPDRLETPDEVAETVDKFIKEFFDAD